MIPLAAWGAPLCGADAGRPDRPKRFGRFESHACLRQEFRQRKVIPELTRPIEGDGEFLFVEGRGLIWRISNPVPSAVFVGSAGLFQIEDERGEPTLVPLDDGPASRLMHDIFSSEPGLLERYFEVEASPRELVLTPRSASLARHVREVRIRGVDRIDEIVITEAEGGETAYTATRATISPLDVSAWEERVLRKAGE